MSRTKTVKLSAVESVRLTREQGDKFVKLELLIGTVPMVSRHIPPDAAREFGHALGFMSNDIARPA